MIIEENFIYNNLRPVKNTDINLTQYGWHKCSDQTKMFSTIKDDYVIHFVLAGQGEYHVCNKMYEIKEGMAFLIKPMEKVKYCPEHDFPWEYMWIGVSGERVEQFVSETFSDNGCDYVVNIKDSTKIIEYLNLLLTAQSDESDELFQQGIMYLTLNELHKQVICVKEAPLKKKNKMYDILKYIQQNYAKNISITSICRAVGIERSTLFKLMKSEFGVSTQEYLNSYKLEMGRALIAETDRPIKEICYSSGFENYSHFSFAFHKKYGISPRDYRLKTLAELLH